jgi:hypothetical protein
MKIMPRGPLQSVEAVPSLGLPWALDSVQEHPTSLGDVVTVCGGDSLCDLDQLGPEPEGWSSPMQR